MTAAKSRIRMQKFGTKTVQSVTDFANDDGTNALKINQMSDCGTGADGLHTVGKFVKVNDKQTISVCDCGGMLYLTSGYNVCAVDSEGNYKELLTYVNFQGKNCRVYGDSLRKRIVFSGTGGVFFTDGTSKNSDSGLYQREMSAIAFAENRIVGALGDTVYVSDALSKTFTADDKLTTAASFFVGGNVTALCGINNEVYVFADGDMYKITVGYVAADFAFTKVAENVGTVRFAVYYKNKMYCFCDEGIRIVDNGVKEIKASGKHLSKAICRPIVWRDKIVYADESSVVMFEPTSCNVDIVAANVQDLAAVGDEFYVVSDYRLYKYDDTMSSSGTIIFEESDFGTTKAKNMRNVVLCGSGNVDLTVYNDGIECCKANAKLTKGKSRRLPCYGTGNVFTVKLLLSPSTNVESIVLQGVVLC